jgi:hypothetical protein
MERLDRRQGMVFINTAGNRASGTNRTKVVKCSRSSPFLLCTGNLIEKYTIFIIG